MVINKAAVYKSLLLLSLQTSTTPYSPLMNSCRVHTFPTVYFSALSPKSTHETLTSLQLRQRFPLISVNPRTQVSWKKAIEPVKMRRNFQICNSVGDNAETQKWMKWVPKGVIAEKILRLIAGATSSPISQFVSSPTTFLHRVDPRIKLVWLLALVVLPARSHIVMRFGLVMYLALLSIWILPTQAWKDQLARVGLLSGILFIMLGLGSDGVPPLVQLRTPPPTMTGLPNLPSALGGYSYLVMKLGPLQLTRKGLSVASTSACLTFTVFQSASLCLTTTTPEQLASALRWFMLPLTHIGVPVAEVILTLLLSLRFITLVFDEVRNAALGIVARRINWQQLTVMETVDIFFMYVRRIFKNIFNHAEQISQAMIARGFRGDGNTHKIYFLSKSSFGIADFVSLLFLAGVIGAAVLSDYLSTKSPDASSWFQAVHYISSKKVKSGIENALVPEIVYSNGVAKEEVPDSYNLQGRIDLYHKLVSGKLLRPILMDEDIKYFEPAYTNCRRTVDSNPIMNSIACNGPSIFDGN